MYYIEFVEKNEGVPQQRFQEVVRVSNERWAADHPGEELVMIIGRTWRLGPEPTYMVVWRIKDFTTFETWNAEFRKQEILDNHGTVPARSGRSSTPASTRTSATRSCDAVPRQGRVVTGASSGIGLAVAERLGAEGAQLVIVGAPADAAISSKRSTSLRARGVETEALAADIAGESTAARGDRARALALRAARRARQQRRRRVLRGVSSKRLSSTSTGRSRSTSAGRSSCRARRRRHAARQRDRQHRVDGERRRRGVPGHVQRVEGGGRGADALARRRPRAARDPRERGRARLGRDPRRRGASSTTPSSGRSTARASRSTARPRPPRSRPCMRSSPPTTRPT